MTHSSLTLRSHALSIWQAGVDAVRSDQLVKDQVRVDGANLRFGEHSVALDSFDRICVVGGGKAAAGLAVGLEQALASIDQPLSGWINVPDDCILPTQFIHLHPARPAGVNEPTVAAAEGTSEILRLAEELGPRDLCIALIAGGGSALLPAPVTDVSLEDKLQVTRLLSHNGADIHQLNTVRKQISRIKGGGLALACNAGQLVSLIISDVLGDPLDVIASGPTVPSTTNVTDALQTLEALADPNGNDVPQSVWNSLRAASKSKDQKSKDNGAVSTKTANVILGNNATSLAACAKAAERLGYQTITLPTDTREPSAEVVSDTLVEHALRIASESNASVCLLSGGEPVVQLAPEETRGVGGRNQQLILAALRKLASLTSPDTGSQQITFLSGGTDGEDGPTDAAGALIWPDLIHAVRAAQLNLDDAIRRNDAYPLLRSLGGLITTGPTQTNVCDVRVILISPIQTRRASE